MRSIWKGSIGFGMVAIPVKMYGSTEDKRIAFNQIHAECGSRIQMPKWCPTCERRLEAAEIKKAYEVSKNQYLPLEPEDFDSLPLASVKTIQIDQFIKGDLADPRYFKDSYFLSPDEVGNKAFSLFMRAMEMVGVVGIAKIAYRDREHLALIRPFDGVMLLQTLHYTDELRPYDELKVSAEISDRELELAQTLVQNMIGDGDLTGYQDEYRKALQWLIEAKLEGKEITETPIPKAKTADLTEQLLASLEATTT